MLGDSPKIPRELSTSKGHVIDEGSEGLMKLHLKIHLEVIYHYIHVVIKKCQDIFFRISYISFLFRIRSFKRGFYSFHVAISKKELLTPLEKKSCFCFVGRAAILVQGWFRGRCKCLVSCDINTKLRGFFDVFIPCTSGHCSVFG